MNKVILMGRLTRDPEVRYSQAAEPLAIARYTLAVDRRFQRRDNSGNEQTADFISCVAFGRNGEFAEKYLKQGTKIAITGRIQTGIIQQMLLLKNVNLQRARMHLETTAVDISRKTDRHLVMPVQMDSWIFQQD